MKTLTGTLRLARLTLRLERFRLSVWIAVLGLLPVVVGSSFGALYGTEASRREVISTVASSPGLVALLGPIHGTSIGSLTTWRIGTFGAVLIALMAVFTVIRHTRLDEETGRRELLGATVVGRHAPLAAATMVTGAAGVTIGLFATVGFVAIGESAQSAVAFGLGWILVTIVFSWIGAFAAQLTDSAGGARAIAVGIIGLSYVVRMAGDGGQANGVGWLTWLSPIGWFSRVQAFGNEEWWVLVLYVGAAGLVGWTTFLLSGHRDVGSGVFPPRPGPAEAGAGLNSAVGLAWRLQGRGLIGWCVSITAFALVWGGLGRTILDVFRDNPQLTDILAALGGTGTLTDVFFGAAMGIIALIVAAYSIGSALTLRTEEQEMRADLVLATSTSRLGWASSHLVYAGFGPVLMMGVAGVAAGSAYGLIAGNVGGQIQRLTELAVLQVPAVWVMAGVAVALYGLVPRLANLSWGVLVVFLLLGQLGQILRLPGWALNLSPFTHVPNPPGPISMIPIIVLTAIAVTLTAVGLSGFQRRDLM